jgi:tetratricopeptide (TPR) repeat protein
MRRIFNRQRVAWAIVVLLLLLYFFAAPILTAARNMYEDISFTVAPSAEKAYAYGERHFNGQRESAYDIARAEYYFNEALKSDPSLPYLHHEMARIYFLRGDFGDALSQIDVQIAEHGTSTPNSYYVRGLIEGYMGDYDDAAKDYAYFLTFDPHDWAGLNDYAWVLMKAGRYAEAAKATSEGLRYFPDNPWLLNSNAIALYETGHLAEAKPIAARALAAAGKIMENDWLHAYPGNDPQIAGAGIASLRKAAADNMHMIQAALASTTVQ